LWCIIAKTYVSFGKLGYVLRSNIRRIEFALVLIVKQ